MDSITLLQVDNEKRGQILEKLGYLVDNSSGFVLEKQTKKEVICKYTKEKVHISTAAILPGSNLVINATPLSMAQYFIEYDNE